MAFYVELQKRTGIGTQWLRYDAPVKLKATTKKKALLEVVDMVAKGEYTGYRMSMDTPGHKKPKVYAEVSTGR